MVKNYIIYATFLIFCQKLRKTLNLEILNILSSLLRLPNAYRRDS